MNRSFNVILLSLTLLFTTVARGEPAPSLKPLDGTWLAAGADCNSASSLSNAWNSQFVIKDGKFKITHFCGTSKDLIGAIAAVPGDEEAIDLNVEMIDLSENWTGVVYPKCTLPAIFKFENNGRLVVCFEEGADRRRPDAFASTSQHTIVLTLVRVDDNFLDFPKDILVTVTDEAGHPVNGASVFTFMSFMPPMGDAKVQQQWNYSELAKTDADGVAKVRYQDLAFYPIAARDVEHKLMGVTPTDPAGLVHGAVTVVLERESHLHGTLESTELTDAGKKIQWTNVYLLFQGKRWGSCASLTGAYDFDVPPGNYTLNAYGNQLHDRNIDVNVPPGQADVQIPPIELTPSRLALLQGNSAPELAGVEAWRGDPVKFADLKGRYVLLDFWGYWCGPCVADIPTLIKLHEQFKDKGLSVIGVHVDLDGEIDTVAKLDEKLATIRPKLWNGKDIPFPVALVSGKKTSTGEHQPGGAVVQYGILSYPTTLLIDRDGKIVGNFAFRDEKAAIEQIEKLLAK